MSTINKNTLVHIILQNNGVRFYLAKVENTRRPTTGELYLKGFWNDDAALSQPWTFEMACIIRDRLKRENNVITHIALQAGDAVDFIGEQEASSTAQGDRTIQHYRGLVIRPFNPRGWCCKLRDDSGERESVRGETPEEVGDKVIERGLFEIAEKAPAPPPEPPKTQQAPYRNRPGSI